MKNGILLVFLLGFGYLAPFSCGRKHSGGPKQACIEMQCPVHHSGIVKG